VNTATSTIIMVVVATDAAVRGGREPIGDRTIAAGMSTTILYTAALVLALAVPALGYLALLVLAMTPVLMRALLPAVRRWRRTTPSPDA